MADIFGIPTDSPGWLEKQSLTQKLLAQDRATAVETMLEFNAFNQIRKQAIDAGMTKGEANVTALANAPVWARKTMQDPFWLQKERAQIGVLNAKAREESAWLSDVPKLAEWQAKPLEQQVKEAPPEMQSNRGIAAASNLRRAASSSAVAKAMNESKSKYDARVAALLQAGYESAGTLALPPQAFPSETNWKALGIAEQALAQRRENEKTLAASEAEARGETPTTTISDRGVTTTYRPSSVKPENVEPQTKVLKDGTILAWMPNGKTIHVIRPSGEKKELTPSQLLAIGKALDAQGDPDASKLISAAKEGAMAKIAPKSTQAAAPKSTLDTATIFTDKTGKRFKYLGNESDPMKDRNESHWQLVP